MYKYTDSAIWWFCVWSLCSYKTVYYAYEFYSLQKKKEKKLEQAVENVVLQRYKRAHVQE